MENRNSVLSMIRQAGSSVLDGYGSFFALTNRWSKLFILVASLLQPYSGCTALFSASLVVFWQHALRLRTGQERIETVNGLLLGMLLGSLYSPSLQLVGILVVGSLLLVTVAAVINDTLTRSFRLPLLGLPYAVTSFLLLPTCQLLLLQPAAFHPFYHLQAPGALATLAHLMQPLGAIYFNGTTLGGILVFTGFLLSSRALAFIALSASAISAFWLQTLGFTAHTELALIAQMNAVLTAMVIGGLFAAPGRRSFVVALVGSVVASVISTSLSRLAWCMSLPVLAVPFVVTTYLTLLALGAQRGGAWMYFWLPIAALPEKALEQYGTARARGVDSRSIGLKAPFHGSWQVYQGFDSKHTHKGPWRFALDFFQMRDGKSFVGSGTACDDYFCFADPVLSPAHGVVVSCRDDLPDNAPGMLDVVNNWGNYIIVRLIGGTFVVLAHLKQGSLRVGAGDAVSPAQPLALCGNSGRSPQPHLHIHVQESAVLGSQTLPFHLTDVLVGDERDAAFAEDWFELDQVEDASLYSLHATPDERAVVTSSTPNRALQRAMQFKIGSTFKFQSSAGAVATATYAVVVDEFGQFWLQNQAGAKVGLLASDSLLAMFDRNSIADPVLDAITLAIGLTPFSQGPIRWSDSVPRRLLPMNALQRLASALFAPWHQCTESQYTRVWDKARRLWIQTGHHRVGITKRLAWHYISEAHLCEANGLITVILRKGEKKLLEISLTEVGLLADNGIPSIAIETTTFAA